MKEIVQLNQHLLDHAKDCLPEDGLMFDRDGIDEDADKIPADLREQIDRLRAEISRSIPDDFGYVVSFEDGEADFRIQYENGPTTVYSPPQKWEPAQSLFPQLEAYDWDGMRSECVSQSEVFDHIADLAKDLLVMMPSTKSVQKGFRDQVKAYIKEKRKQPGVHVLFWDGDESLFDEVFESMEVLQHQLHDIMPHMVHVVTIVADVRPVPAEKIDSMKRTALRTLEDSLTERSGSERADWFHVRCHSRPDQAGVSECSADREGVSDS